MRLIPFMQPAIPWASARGACTAMVMLTTLFLLLPSCTSRQEKVTSVTVTHPVIRRVTISTQYKGQIQSHRFIKVRASTQGFLETVAVREGQVVTAGDLMFQISPELHQVSIETDKAKIKVAESELEEVRKKFQENIASEKDVLKYEAKLARAQAQLAATELNAAAIKAPFDGVIGAMKFQQGSLVNQGDVLTTLADDSLLWVYFNMPEAGYLEYMGLTAPQKEQVQAELLLSSGDKFPHAGTIGAIQSNFNNQTGRISFRADFPNPDKEHLHGLSGNVLISEVIGDAIVVPQRSVLEILNKRYVYIVTQDNIARQREIDVEHELEDLFVVKSGISVDDTIISDGLRMIRDGDKVTVTTGNASVTK